MPKLTGYAAIHALAVREALHAELAVAIGEIRRATHVTIIDGKIWCYGTESEALEFAEGLRRASVRPITGADRDQLEEHKRRVYGRR